MKYMKHASFFVIGFLTVCLGSALGGPVPAPVLHRYLYVATPDGAQADSGSGVGMMVFDLDKDFALVRRIEVPSMSEGVRGLTGCMATRALYFSTTSRRLGAFDLKSEKVLWNRQYEAGCDRSSITPDGRTLYAPTGWWIKGDDDGLLVIDAATGENQRRIKLGKTAHNSLISADGKRLFLGTQTTLHELDPADGRVLQSIPDVGETGVFPFTVDAARHYAYVCLGAHVGFDVVDLQQGKAVHRVMAGEAPIAHRTHGAALTPDEQEVWISDQDGKRLYIFNNTVMPPTAAGHVELSMGGHGWVNFSMDGKFAWSHTPDIFDVKTRKKVATLRDEKGTPVGGSKLIEVHFFDGQVVAVGSEFGLGRKGLPQPVRKVDGK